MARLITLAVSAIACGTFASAANILFDASRHEMAGNADWVVDADAWDLTMPAYPCSESSTEVNPSRLPTPAQSGITPATAETYWKGAVSAWAVELAKAGHTIETLPPGGLIAYGDGANPQDLSHYELFIVVEPLTPYTGSEDWFDEATDTNVSIDAADTIINGPFGSGAGGLGLFGSTSMDLRGAALTTAHVWRNGQPHNALRVTFATASYFIGRVAAVGDSSPADDGTGDTADSLHPGWDKVSGGVANRELFLNACAWLLNAPPDLSPPGISSGPSAAPGDCSATVTWGTDEPATSAVDYGTTSGYGSPASSPGSTQGHEVVLSPLAPGTEYHFRVSSVDQAGNGPTQSADDAFTTAAAAPPAIASGPSAITIHASDAAIVWTTDELATSEVLYGLTAAYGLSASSAGLTTSHTVALSGLSPQTTCHLSALSTDACGNGPVSSPGLTFATASAAVDISGWSLRQFNSVQAFVLPQGTSVSANGYPVIGRDASEAEFAAAHPGMPPGTPYLNSNANGSCSAGCFPLINGGESLDRRNTLAQSMDGPTIALAEHFSAQRVHPGDPAGAAASWTVTDDSLSTPGSGAGSGNGSSIRINELSDASDYTKEFIELYNDASGAADTLPPAQVTDLVVVPLSSHVVRMTWTATGDDAATGTATPPDLARQRRQHAQGRQGRLRGAARLGADGRRDRLQHLPGDHPRLHKRHAHSLADALRAAPSRRDRALADPLLCGEGQRRDRGIAGVN